MNNILSEKDFQKFILERLEKENGYIIRPSQDYDRLFAVDREMLFKFLADTQPKKMAQLSKQYGDKVQDTLVHYINTVVTQKNSSMLNTLKHGIEINGIALDLMYPMPATSFNPDLVEKYNKNIFSVMEEVWASDTERIDLVIFLNGIAIMSFELKANTAGQSYEDAIAQYRSSRDPKTRLFLFKAGCLVNFAMDLNEVYMTTKLAGTSTYFLPFNMGNGNGIKAGAGNPVFVDKYSVSYMWEDILQKDTVIDLINRFVFIETSEKEDVLTGKVTKKENVIFPRYHQLDCVRRVLADVVVNHTSQNYLIQHSAGSGKTNSIAWLSHRLSSLHDANDKIIFDNIVIVTDRVVVDRQLQRAVMGLEHKSGLIKVMDEKCTSSDLAKALKGNTKIIATTIQKFPYILDEVKGLKDKHFAVIIDEAHSSTAGKDMAAVTRALGSDIDYEDDAFNMDTEDIIVDEISKNGKQSNVSMFAFTATPKATTLQLFGRVNVFGHREAFHIYSMKQAIEEGFILDVLQNYTTYTTMYQINKEIEQDPKYKTNAAKKKITRFAMLHETNIAQRVEVIIEHFRNTVANELGGQAKAMVITGSRAEAVKYHQAFEAYIQKNHIKGVHALVAFSGKVAGKQLGMGDDISVTESSLNGFAEDKTPVYFDSNDYQVMIVANKYQTGFDQPKLCAMYVLKKLKGVNAVQTLSRLNRIFPPFDKKTFILDFVNTYEDIEKSFEPYYTTTLLTNTVTKELIYELEQRMDEYSLIDQDDLDNFNNLLYGQKSAEQKQKLNAYLAKSKKKFDVLDIKQQRKAYITVRRFVRFYEFLILATSFEDVTLHKKYNYSSYLVSYLSVRSSGNGFSLEDKINATNFSQNKGKTVVKSDIKANPNIKISTADALSLTDDEEKKLSEIIKEVNSRAGTMFDNDVATKAALSIKDILIKSDNLKISAQNNSFEDFKFAYYDLIDDALMEGWSQNQEFFSMLLGNEEIKKNILNIFMPEVYKTLRSGEAI